MAIEGRTLAKDFHQLLKNVHGMSGGQVAVTDWEDDLTTINVTVTPSDGYYKGGQFVFEIKNPKEGNFDNPPRVYCKTMIYHPNIDTLEDDGEICLNLLEDDMWTSHMGLEDVIQGILFLLYNPNLEDPLTCIFSPDMSEEEFEDNVKVSLEGGCIEGYEFTKPKIKPTDGTHEEGMTEVREEPDGAEEVHVDVEKERDEEKEHKTEIKDEIEPINRVIRPSECDKENEIVNTCRFDTECNMIEEDEGTPVDGYPQIQTTGDVKAKGGVNGAGTIVRYERTSPNSVSFQRGGGGKAVPGRFNFWLGMAIRRVRGWNVF